MESILLVMVASDTNEIKKACVRYLSELKDMRPALSGKDLMELGIQPGPKYSKIFQQILYEKLRGNLKTREEELEYVKSLIR